MNNRDNTFTESSQATNLLDFDLGRGVICFDYDEDGAMDIFVSNNQGPTRLYRNTLDPNPGWLQVDIVAESPGETTAGTVIEVDTGTLTQHRQLTLGSNFESQNPLRQHFGLGGATTIDEVRVTWPSGFSRTLSNVGINQILVVYPDGPGVSSITPSLIGPTNTDSVEFAVTFSENVVNFNDSGDVIIHHNGTAHSGISIDGAGATYLVTVDGISGTGSFTLEVKVDSDVRNTSGVGLNAGATSTPVNIDNSRPTLSIGPPSQISTTDGPVTFNIDYEGADSISLHRTDVALKTTGSVYADLEIKGNGNKNRTVTVSHIVGSGTLSIEIAPGTATDLAGNSCAAAGPSDWVTVLHGNLIHHDSFEE